MKMKLAIIAVLGVLGLVACGPALQAQPCYPAGHVIDVDGYQYVDRGVYDGAPPDDTIIPQDDPPVGQLVPSHDAMPPQSIFTSAD
jgi:hypothetical protein